MIVPQGRVAFFGIVQRLLRQEVVQILGPAPGAGYNYLGRIDMGVDIYPRLQLRYGVPEYG